MFFKLNGNELLIIKAPKKHKLRIENPVGPFVVLLISHRF